MRITCAAVALVLTACGAVADSTSLATPSSAPTVGLIATPTPTTSPDDPIALGPDDRVGTLSGGLIYGWIYNGRRGSLTLDTTPFTGQRAVSPSGRYELQQRQVMAGAEIDRVDVWLVDHATGAERVLYVPPPRRPGGRETHQPNPNATPYVFQRTEYVGPWAPDERYVALWQIDVVSASADADGRPLVVIDVATGTQYPLGYALYSPPQWRAPHTLAFSAGAGREAWVNKTLRVWTPESGTTDITATGEVGLRPAWGPDGRLWYASGPAGAYDKAAYFAGRGVGDHTIRAVDLASGVRVSFPRESGYADEAIRLSERADLVLVLRRRLDPTGGDASWLELWATRPDGSGARALIRVGAVNGFGYYGEYVALSQLEWFR